MKPHSFTHYLCIIFPYLTHCAIGVILKNTFFKKTSSTKLNIFLYSRSVSSRKEIPSNKKSAVVDDDITFRIDGEKMSKNRYFFGGELKSAIKSKSSRGPKEKGPKPRKTAVDIFLEDQGPYSRKLYGPAPNGGGEGELATVCLHLIFIFWQIFFYIII